jgi:uncharacterized membrane protein YhaH (DUF805 family)
MNVGSLFFGLDGRIARRQWWIGVIVVEAIVLAVKWLAGLPVGDDPPTTRLRAVAFVIELVAAYPLAALAVKRLHDRDYAARAVWPLVAAFAVIMVGDLFAYFDPSAPMTPLKLILMVIVAAVAIGYFIEMGFRRSDPEPNRYGPASR